MQTKNEYEKIRDLSVEAFKEYVNEQNKLQSVDQNKCISEIVLHCPDDEMDKLHQLINAVVGLSHESNDQSSEEDSNFQTKLCAAFVMKKDLLTLSDTNMSTPHLHLIVLDLDGDCVNEFNQLARSVFQGNEKNIVNNLAKHTPSKDRSRVAMVIANLFPNSELKTELGAAFERARENDKMPVKSEVQLDDNTVSQPVKQDTKSSVQPNSNTFFVQSEVRNRHVDTQPKTQEETIPQKFNLLHSDDAEERSCCETMCTIF